MSVCHKHSNPLLQLCKKHHFGMDKPEKLAPSPEESMFLMKTFSQIKSNVPVKKKVWRRCRRIQMCSAPLLSLFKGLLFLCLFSPLVPPGSPCR